MRRFPSVIIKSLNIKVFGKHKDLVLQTKPGLNVVYGPNEAGKSTLQAFIKAMLYGINSRFRTIRDNDRLKYKPWDGSPMAGEMLVEKGGIDYSIIRSFGDSKRQDRTEMYKTISAEPVPLKGGEEPGEWLLGITQDTFENTVFIKQLSPAIDSSAKSGEILSRLASLAGSGDEEASVKKVEERLKKAREELHSSRGSRGLIDKLQAEKNQLTEELNRFYQLKSSTAENIHKINDLKKRKAELQQQISELEQRKIQLEKSRILSEWKELSDYIDNKGQYITQLNQLYDSITFEGETISRSKLESMKYLFRKYTDSLHTLAEQEKTCAEAEKTYSELERELKSKAALEHADINQLQAINSQIAALENIARQLAVVKEKMDALKKEIQMEESKYEKAREKIPEKPSSMAFYLVLAILCLVMAITGFVRAGIILIIPGVIGFLFSLAILIYNSKKYLADNNAYERNLTEISRAIEEKKALKKVYEEQADLLFKSSEYDVSTDNLHNRIEELKKIIHDTLKAAGCQDLSGLEKEIAAYRFLKYRLEDAGKNLELQRKKYQEARKVFEQQQEEFYTLFNKISDFTDVDQINSKLKEIEECLDKADELKNKLEQVNIAISSILRGRDITELREKAARIETGFIPCEYSDIQYDEISSSLEQFTRELNGIEQEIIKLNGIIASTFRGTRSEEELQPLIDGITEQINEYEYYYSCLELAQQVLNEAFEELQKSFGPLLNEETARIFNHTTNHKYGRLYISKDFNIMLDTGSDISLKDSNYLSMGTLDQLYFSLRISIANLIAGHEEALPLFLDDTFVQYDEERVRRVLEFICQEALKRQIFIFTCHDRIIHYLREQWEDQDSFQNLIINLH